MSELKLFASSSSACGTLEACDGEAIVRVGNNSLDTGQ